MSDKYVKIIEGMNGKYSVWDIWSDFVTVSAIAIANVCDKKQAPKREAEYTRIMNKYTIRERFIFKELFDTLVDDLEKNPDRDILGDVYMKLRINSKQKGQYFTPYCLSKGMAKMVLDKNLDGPLIFNEPTCGSGSNLIAAANVLKEEGFNYQQNAYFVAQDIDSIVAKMCYIQMSLLGMPGVVVIGNTLLGMTEEMDHWYTLFHFLYGEEILKRHREKCEREKERKKERVISFEEDWMLDLVGLR